ncbi:MAG: hypothetical protein HC927_07395 [Deltaproteobacteria bacterium]|nr:hypothetical protein [Deltaproteobacteria bacterium]
MLLAAFVVVAGSTASQGCVAPFDCITIWVERAPKLCANLEPVMSSDRSGPLEIVDEFGSAPSGCACINGDQQKLAFTDPDNPALDPVYAEILADAQQRCMEMAVMLNADVSPCASAVLAEPATVTDEVFSECKYIAKTIDENQDGDCPVGGDEAEGDDEAEEDDETETEDEESGGIVPDLPVGDP